MKIITTAFLLFAACGLLNAQQKQPKIFIESISQPHQAWNFLTGWQTEGAMAAPSAIERALQWECQLCQFVAKREKADYVATFAARNGFDWSVIDNTGDGKTIASKHVILEANAYKDVAAVIWKDWISKREAIQKSEIQAEPDHPEDWSPLKVNRWELPENETGEYQVKIFPSDLNEQGALVIIKIKKISRPHED